MIDRETAFRLAEGAISPQVDEAGKLHDPELVILERAEPGHRDLTQKVRKYLEAQVRYCGMRRRDEEAIKGLGEALQMAARLLTAQEIVEGEGGGPVASTRRAFMSLGRELVGHHV